MKVRQKFSILAVLLLAVGLTSAVQAADPVLAYETTVSGYWLASGRGMVIDDEGNAYVIGPFYEDQVHLDILVVKVGPDGTVLWTTTIIGNDHDYAAGIVLDNEQNVYITGWTDSDDFPVLNALDNTLTGFRDAFVTKLSGQDGTILYSTFLGGDYVDQSHGIALNSAGEIYIAGTTESSDFPTVNPIQDALNSFPYGYSDAFITKLSADGTTILYSTYLGGTNDDSATGIALDADDNIYITGNTESTDFPTADPLQPAYDGAGDLFVARIFADGSALDYSTYLGGEDWDRVAGISVDGAGSAYVAGTTRSIYFPTTPGAFQEIFAGEIAGCEVPFGGHYNCEDVFVTKLAPDGSALAYSTYLGGSSIDECGALTVDNTGCAYVVGNTVSPDFPPSGIQSSADIFVSRLNANGSDLTYTFTKSSASANAGHGIAVDSQNNTYFAGAIHAPAEVYIGKLTAGGEMPGVTVTISSPLVQVSKHSNFLFNVQITNNEAATQTFQVWTAAQKIPAGLLLEPLKGPVTVTLQPGQTKTFRNIPQYIGNVPSATYRYFVCIGESVPTPRWDEDYWDFEVIP